MCCSAYCNSSNASGNRSLYSESVFFHRPKANTKAESYINIGIAYYNSNKYQEAIDNYTQAIYLNPNNDDAYFNRGQAYYILGKYRKAINDYTQFISFSIGVENLSGVFIKEVDEAYHNRGRAYYYLEEYQKAIDDYTQAININPNYDYAYNNRGLAYVKLENRQRAIRDFRKAASLGNEAAKENLSYY